MPLTGHLLLSQSSLQAKLLGKQGQALTNIICSELATLEDADFLRFGLAITVFTYFESLGQLKEASDETSTTLSDFSMISAVGPVGISPQKKFFSLVDYF